VHPQHRSTSPGYQYFVADWNDQKAVVTPPAPIHVRDHAFDRREPAGISRLRLGKNAGYAPHGLNS